MLEANSTLAGFMYKKNEWEEQRGTRCIKIDAKDEDSYKGR